MDNEFSRVEMLIGKDKLDLLKSKRIIVFGCGGVGGFVIESLVRSGVGHIAIVDNDDVDITNINRQIIANHKTVGKDKVDVFKERLLLINPQLVIETYKMFYLKETASQIDLSKYDYVVDAIDTVSAKLELIERCQTLNIPIISSMGTGNKLDPSKLEITDIYKTSGCPLAKVMRKECKDRHIKKCTVLYSKELPIIKQRTPSSMMFVPASAGLMIGSYIVRQIIGG